MDRPVTCLRGRTSDRTDGAGQGAEALARELGGVPVVHSDDFYLPMDGDPLRWWEPFRTQVLVPLLSGHEGRFRRYDWRSDSFAEDVVTPPAPIVIVEGVGSAWRPATPYLSLSIWVDAPLKVRVSRTEHRDGPEAAPLWESWRKSEAQHFTHDRTQARADLTVDGTA